MDVKSEIRSVCPQKCVSSLASDTPLSQGAADLQFPDLHMFRSHSPPDHPERFASMCVFRSHRHLSPPQYVLLSPTARPHATCSAWRFEKCKLCFVFLQRPSGAVNTRNLHHSGAVQECHPHLRYVAHLRQCTQGH